MWEKHKEKLYGLYNSGKLRILEDNITLHISETGTKYMNWFQLFQIHDLALVLHVLNLWTLLPLN
jgi:hypothetical protein